ncbi:hypothetical protein CWS72_23950 [Telmatospirillum siberiense]|uniref:Uncharacterized protein n=1 Tax=Telmatospirillum siberiense TaxID=382514 RepID=A0A2N3PNK2_9PROT|nr:hypothetical protein CWS72_23950 [Telmatospirillum siberiense]
MFWDADDRFQKLSSGEQNDVKRLLAVIGPIFRGASNCVYLSLDTGADDRERLAAYEHAHPGELAICPLERGEVAGLGRSAAQTVWPALLWAHVGKLIVGDAWAKNPQTVEEVVQGVMIAAGVRNRPAPLSILKASGPEDLASGEGGVRLPLDVIAQNLSEVYRELRAAGDPAGPQATALARLFHMHELIQRQRPDPYFGKVPALRYDVLRMKALSNKVKPRLATESIDEIQEDDLDEFFGELSFEPEFDAEGETCELSMAM